MEIDPALMGISVEALGLEESVSDLVVYFSLWPLHLVAVGGGEISDARRVELLGRMSSETYADELVQHLLQTARNRGQDIELHDSGYLPALEGGEFSRGVFADYTADELRLRVEFIEIIRENLYAVIVFFTDANAEPLVPFEELARMLDAKMIEVLSAR